LSAFVIADIFPFVLSVLKKFLLSQLAGFEIAPVGAVQLAVYVRLFFPYVAAFEIGDVQAVHLVVDKCRFFPDLPVGIITHGGAASFALAKNKLRHDLAAREIGCVFAFQFSVQKPLLFLDGAVGIMKNFFLGHKVAHASRVRLFSFCFPVFKQSSGIMQLKTTALGADFVLLFFKR